MRWLFWVPFIFSCSVVHAEVLHERIRRVTVFPFKVEGAELNQVAEKAWWDLREKLTESKRFLVASKNFMQAIDVFQPRGELQPADAIILGRLLDANALISTFVVGRKISMRVYETKNGLTLWQGDVELHPALAVSQQFPDAAKKLLFDFISSIPYQGFVVVDNLIGRPSYYEGERLLFKADVGAGTQVTVGDTAQLIRVKGYRLKPLFQEGATIEYFVEGKVVNVDRQIITVQVTRKQEGSEIHEGDLLRIPDELRRLKEIYGMHEDPSKNVAISSIKADNDELTERQKEKKPLVTSLSWIANFAIVLLLAF